MHGLALSRPISTIVGVLSLILLGLFSLAQLPVALLPALERPLLLIDLEARGQPREGIVTGAIIPLERRLSSLSGITSLWSEAEDGRGRIVLEPSWQTDPDRLQLDSARLVEGAAEIRLDRLDVTVTGGDPVPVIEIGVLGGESASARTEFARKVVLPEISRLPGAGRIQLIGLAPLHAVVRPWPAAMAARGVDTLHILKRLESLGTTVAAGTVRDGANVRPLVIQEKIDSLEKLRQVLIETPRGPAVMGDLAEVGLEEFPDSGSFILDGESGVLLRIFRAPGANAVALAGAVNRSVDALGGRIMGKMRLEVVGDRSGEILSALKGLALAAAGGILLGTLVLRTMLGRWSPTLALSVVLPASMLISFGAFRLFGIPLDVISLAGLALAAGMLVDNSIVVLEAIESARSRGEANPALAGTGSVALAVTGSCATTIVVFLPLLYIGGLARSFFGEQAFAVASSVLVSLILSLTLTPVLAKAGGSGPGRASRELKGFRRLLETALARPGAVITLGAAATAVSLTIFQVLPRELLPRGSSRVARARFSIPRDLSPEGWQAWAAHLEAVARRAVDSPGGEGSSSPLVSIKTVLADEITQLALPGASPSTGSMEIEFTDAASAARMIPEIETALKAVPDLEAEVEPRPTAFAEAVVGGKSRLEIVLAAPSEAQLEDLAARVQETVEGDLGVRPRADANRRPSPTYWIRWERSRLAALGGGEESLGEAVSSAVGGRSAGRVEILGVEPEIRIEPPPGQSLGEVPVALPPAAGRGDPGEGTAAGGRVVPVSALAGVGLLPRTPRLRRVEGQPATRMVLSSVEAPGIDAPRLEGALERVPLRAGEKVSLGGEAAEIRESFLELRLALVLSLILVFLILAALYESFSLPLLIMSVVPVAAGGALLALALCGQSINVMSILGLIILGGIAVNNSIVLVDRMESLARQEVSAEEGVRRAVMERLRPVMMTAMTTVLGMLPLAIVGGAGIELRRSLSIAVLGGVISSTFASLLLLPVLYRLLVRRRGGRRAPAVAAS